MQANDIHHNRVRRTVNDLVMAEMFLLQATIESATAIGDGFGELSRQISNSDRDGDNSWQEISDMLQRVTDEALEPYTTRYKYFRKMISGDRAD